MSAAITTYAVDLGALCGAVGSGDPRIARRVRDAHFRPEDRERIRALVVYGPESVTWSDGAYALEALCRAFGHELPGSALGALGDEAPARLAALDRRLAALGVDFSWAHTYAASGAPCTLPRPRGWPRVFHLDAA